jgi:hypothetical protein
MPSPYVLKPVQIQIHLSCTPKLTQKKTSRYSNVTEFVPDLLKMEIYVLTNTYKNLMYVFALVHLGELRIAITQPG